MNRFSPEKRWKKTFQLVEQMRQEKLIGKGLWRLLNLGAVNRDFLAHLLIERNAWLGTRKLKFSPEYKKDYFIN